MNDTKPAQLSPRRPKRSLRRRLAFISIGVMVLLGTLEIILRLTCPASTLLHSEAGLKMWFLENVETLRQRGRHARHASHPILGWTLRPNLRLPGESSNSLGMRGPQEFALERPPGVKRALFLGDSFTYGAYVKDDEVYAAQIGKLLPDHEILNLGVNAYGTDQQLLRWLHEGRKYKPDFVVLGFYIDDFHRNVTTWRGEGPKPRFLVVDKQLERVGRDLPPLEDLDKNRTRIAKELSGLRWTPRFVLGASHLWHRIGAKIRDHREPDDTFDEKARIAELLIRRFAATCAELGTKFAVVSIPMEYPNYPDEARIEAVLSDSCERARIPFLRLTKTLGVSPEDLGKRRIYNPENAHWNAFGHSVAARLIVEFLRENSIVD